MNHFQLIVMACFLAAGGFTFLRVVALARAAEVDKATREAQRAARAAEQAAAQAARPAQQPDTPRSPPRNR